MSEEKEQHPWNALQQTPLSDLKRRAKIVDTLEGIETVELAGAERFASDCGDGDALAWYFTDDGKVLLVTYMHESELNVYDFHEEEGKDYAVQRSYFRGVPDDLVALVENQDETNEMFNIEDPAGRTIQVATGVYWSDGNTWHIAEGLLEHCRNEGLDVFDEAGFYMVYMYVLGRPFTPEEYHAATFNEFLSAEENQERLERLRTVFASVR